MRSLEPKLHQFLESAPIFFQPWWLEAVAPGLWDYAVARKGEEITGIFAYTAKRKAGCWRLLEMPPLTPWLGPWLRPSAAKYANRLSEEKEVLSELIAALPPFANLDMNFPPHLTNWLPFYWQGFHQTTCYTYRFEETADPKALWDETRPNIRTDVRKAEKVVKVKITDDLDQFLRVNRLTFERQGKPLPYAEATLREMDRQCAQRSARRILIAEDAQGRIHAGVYLVTDAKTVYYLMGGGDPELRNSGATSLLVWKAIEWASETARAFDFEGSMVEPIERFVRSFGARQTPCFSILKSNSFMVGFYRALWRLTHRSPWT